MAAAGRKESALNRVLQSKIEKDQKKRQRPPLDSLTTGYEVRKWLPQLKSEIAHTIGQLCGARNYTVAKKAEFAVLLEQLKREHHKWEKRARELSPERAPGEPRPYISKRKRAEMAGQTYSIQPRCLSSSVQSSSAPSSIQSGSSSSAPQSECSSPSIQSPNDQEPSRDSSASSSSVSPASSSCSSSSPTSSSSACSSPSGLSHSCTSSSSSSSSSFSSSSSSSTSSSGTASPHGEHLSSRSVVPHPPTPASSSSSSHVPSSSLPPSSSSSSLPTPTPLDPALNVDPLVFSFPTSLHTPSLHKPLISPSIPMSSRSYHYHTHPYTQPRTSSLTRTHFHTNSHTLPPSVSNNGPISNAAIHVDSTINAVISPPSCLTIPSVPGPLHHHHYLASFSRPSHISQQPITFVPAKSGADPPQSLASLQAYDSSDSDNET